MLMATLSWRSVMRQALGFGALLLIGILALQGFFALRIAAMAWIDPESTTFQRSEAWRLATRGHDWHWSQQWVSHRSLSDALRRAVIASEDAAFTQHAGVDWDSLQTAWEKNQKAEARAERIQARKAATAPKVQAKVVGGSTITQQLAKNLFLSGERTSARKAQELLITWMLEAVLSKDRILDIYLNSVEWGEGVFGAQAAARRYHQTDAAKLNAEAAAQLAVMLPAPKRFEKQPRSDYILNRSATIVARMPAVTLPRSAP